MTATSAATTATVIGLDIGTTTSKALVRPVGSGPPGTASPVVVETPTPWTTRADVGTETDPAALLAVAVDLIGRAVRTAESRWGAVGVVGVSVTGLAESGVLITGDGRTPHPAVAWFDRRGDRELADVAARHPGFAAAFPGVTGLPWSFQSSFATLLWWSTVQPAAPGSVWLSVPEWIVHGLGGERVREASLASRTGLVRQSSGEVWAEAAALAGLPAGFLPDARPAGSPAGRLRHDGVPACARGAVLSVAGHDHPVAALAVGAVGAGELFNSSGTADVMARAVPSTLTDADRAAIVAARWSAGRHVLPGTDLLLAGGGGGLLLRRVLDALGATDPAARERLDAAARAVTGLPPGLVVRGDGRDQADVEIRLGDGAGPATIWAAATAYAAGLTRAMLDDIEPLVGPHDRAVAAGGWLGMASVRAAKARAVGRLEFSTLRQPGATGAALLAEYSLTAATVGLADFLQHTTTSVDVRP